MDKRKLQTMTAHTKTNYYLEKISNFMVRVIPHGTVDNNPGPDCLAGPKALDPNYCRQPTL